MFCCRIGVLGSGRSSGKRSDRRRDLPDIQRASTPTSQRRGTSIPSPVGHAVGLPQQLQLAGLRYQQPVGQRPGLPGAQAHCMPGGMSGITIGSRDAQSSNAKGNRDARGPAKGQRERARWSASNTRWAKHDKSTSNRHFSASSKPKVPLLQLLLVT